MLAHMADGLSNGQIASGRIEQRMSLGAHVHRINKTLADKHSFLLLKPSRNRGIQKSRAGLKHPGLPGQAGIKSNGIAISEVSADQIRSLVAKGYEIASVELIRRAGRIRRKR